MKKILEKITEKVKRWKWAKENPKKFYIYSIVILIILLIFNVTLEVLYTTKKSDSSFLLPLYQKSEFKIEEEQKKQENTKKRRYVIVEELKKLKIKREQGLLTHNDSIRIEFLYHQYKSIENEK